MRDQFNLSGDFRGAIVNINSTLDRASQTLSDRRQELAGDGAVLRELLERLKAQLASEADEHAEDAEALALTTTQMVEAAAAERPNRSLIAGSVQAVLTGGRALLAASPTIATTIGQIVDTVQKIHDLSKG